MSCFIVTDATIHHAIRGLELLDPYRPNAIGTFILERSADLDKLGQYMLHLNDLAFCYRYSHKGEKADPIESIQYRYTNPFFNGKSPGIVECYKAAQCWLYQCSESDAIMSDPVFVEMEKAVAMMERKIIDELPEYKAAPWGHE